MPINAAGQRESRAERKARLASTGDDAAASERRMKKRLKIVEKRMRLARREAQKLAEFDAVCADDDALAALPLQVAATTPPRAKVARAPPSPVAMQPFVPSVLLQGSLDLLAEQIDLRRQQLQRRRQRLRRRQRQRKRRPQRRRERRQKRRRRMRVVRPRTA